ATSPDAARPADAARAIVSATADAAWPSAAASGWRKHSAAGRRQTTARGSLGCTVQRFAGHHIDQGFFALANRRGLAQLQAFEQAEILGAAPPQIRVRHILRAELEALIAQHLQILPGTFLHVHRVAEQPA